MKSITVIRTSYLSLPHSVRSYIDGCAHEYSETDPWTKIAQLAYRLKRGANLLPDFFGRHRATHGTPCLSGL